MRMKGIFAMNLMLRLDVISSLSMLGLSGGWPMSPPLSVGSVQAYSDNLLEYRVID